jgi:N-terminal acetyltransferase B complex catalytic subunit
MTTLRPFLATDILRFNMVNIDHLTETFNTPFYGRYLSKFNDLCITALAPSGNIGGYMMGNLAGEGKEWHGHISAVTVAPMYRRLGLARKLMDEIEEISEKKYVSSECCAIPTYITLTPLFTIISFSLSFL